MYDDGLDGDGNVSSAEDQLLDDQSSNAESVHSSITVKYWQDWKLNDNKASYKPPTSRPPSLYDLCCKITAKTLSFDSLEAHHQAIINRQKLKEYLQPIKTELTPEEKRNFLVNVIEQQPRTPISSHIFVSIIKNSFPEDEQDIQLYCNLTHGTSTCYRDGENIFKRGLVKNVMQIGYLVNAEVEISSYDGKLRNKYSDGPSSSAFFNTAANKVFHVTINIDRQRIISATCTCVRSNWCHHIVAASLYRIHNASTVEYRTTMFDAVNELDNEKLKKLFQYFVTTLPPQYLTTGQKFIDELRIPSSQINLLSGAPDPTDGGHEEVPIWNVDENSIRTKLSVVLINFIKPKSVVIEPECINVEHHPPVSDEYKIRYAALKSREPKAVWSFFDIVCEMFSRKDENAASLLHMITADCLAVDQLVVWWYQAKLMASGKWHTQLFSLESTGQQHNNSYVQSMFQTEALFDKIVELWKIAALNPRVTTYEKEQLICLLQFYQKQAVKQIMKSLKKPEKMKMMINNEGLPLTVRSASFKMEYFPGFYAAIQACHVDFNSAELRCVPSSATKFTQLSDYEDDCLNIPILRNNKSFFQKDLKLLSVTTAYVPGSQAASGSSRPNRHSHSHKSSKKKRRPKHKNRSHRQPISHQSSSSGSGATVEFSAEDDSFVDETDDGLQNKEAHELELDEFFALTHEEREPFQVRFDACVALAHHGYTREAVYMSIKLAKDMLSNIPNVLYEGKAYENKPVEWITVNEDTNLFAAPKKDVHPICTGLLVARPLESYPQKMEVQLPRSTALSAAKVAVDYLERVLKLMKILLNGFQTASKYEMIDQIILAEDGYKLALELGTTALSLKRYASPSHQHEIYLNYLEFEIFEALQAVKLTNRNTIFLRQLAMSVIGRCKTTTTNILPPTLLALFLVETLTANGKIVKEHGETLTRDATDNDLGFQVALGCLEVKLSYLEENFPMLFECVRKHSYNLAFELVVQCKDDITGLGLILDKFLDPDTHKMYEDHDSNAAYFLEKDTIYRQHITERKRPTFPWTRKEKSVPQIPSSSEGGEAITEKDTETSQADVDKPSSSATPLSAIAKPDIKSLPSLLDALRPPKPYVTPHATEALSHFYSSLGMKIFAIAGGSSQNNFSTNQNNAVQRIHRNLFMSAFLIGMYSVGIGNQTVPKWEARTQFGHNVGWLHNVVLEIGKPAMEHVRRIWHRHFTPAETASLADKASHRPEQETMHQGGLLALSVLYKANHLQSNEVINRLRQCRELHLELAEEACIILERVGIENCGFSSVALFQAAKYWQECYECDGSRSNQFVIPQDPAAQYPILNNPNDQYQRFGGPYMYYNQQSHMPPYPAPLHPSHSAPNLLPQANVPYYNYDTGYYYASNACNPYYLSRNLPTCHSQKSMPNPTLPICPQPPVNALPPSVPYNYNTVQRNPSMHLHNPMRPVHVTEKRLIKLLNAYRVGILAIKSQRISENDKKTFGESLLNPSYEDDLTWLFGCCKILGLLYVNSFFEHVAAFVTAPKVLLHFVGEAKKFYGTQQNPGYAFRSNINQQAYIEQLPLSASLGLFSMQMGMTPYSSGSSSCSTSGNTSPNLVLNPPLNNGLSRVAVQSDMKHIRNTMCHEAEQTIKVTQRCIEMLYYAVCQRLNFPKLIEKDANSLRMLLTECHQAYQEVPDGNLRFEAFIRHWRNQKCSKKRSCSDIRMKEVFEEYLHYKNPEGLNYYPHLAD